MTTSGDGGDLDPQLDAFSVDVRDLLQRSVANLYSHLVTRPTGRAVRLAIEAQLQEISPPALSLVDLSSVSVLDYSCADEVVAKLLLQGAEGSPPRGGTVYFIFQGLKAHHREPILEVLNRHELAAVVQAVGRSEPFQLMGVRSSLEEEVWSAIESRGRIPGARIPDAFPEGRQREVVDGLARRGLLFRHPLRGDIHALSHLARRFE